MLKQHFILVVLWVLFSFFHSVFASEKLKKRVQLLMNQKFKYYRIAYSFFAFVSLGITLVYNFKIESIPLWKPPLIETILAITGIISSGCAIIFFASKFFFHLSGAGIFLKTNTSDTLIKTSLYKHVRHPLYAITLVFIWSIFLVQPTLNNLISCTCMTLYTLIGIYFEEKKLINDFGDSYIRYKASTPMLVPKL